MSVGTNATQEDTTSNVTPNVLCRLHNVARHNKIKPEFVTKSKKKGKIKVVLTLGEDNFPGNGIDIKSAHRDAAQNALNNTQLQFPKPKSKVTDYRALTPTVKLNGILMSHGLQSTYADITGPSTNNGIHILQDTANSYCFQMKQDTDGWWQSPTIQNRPIVNQIMLTVGQLNFCGEGRTIQIAKHHAAEKALVYYDENPDKLPSSFAKTDEENPAKKSKSDITALYEVASHHKLTIEFQVLSEDGLPHMKQYTIRLSIVSKHSENNISLIGQGPSKKAAKRNASSMALEKLTHLQSFEKKKAEPKPAMPPAKEMVMHPVSRLLQITQAKKWEAPVYNAKEETSPEGRKVLFCIECRLQNESVIGEGWTKKDAKRKAAELMFVKCKTLLTPNIEMQPTKSSLKSKSDPSPSPENAIKRKVTFNEKIDSKNK